MNCDNVRQLVLGYVAGWILGEIYRKYRLRLCELNTNNPSRCVFCRKQFTVVGRVF